MGWEAPQREEHVRHAHGHALGHRETAVHSRPQTLRPAIFQVSHAFSCVSFVSLMLSIICVSIISCWLYCGICHLKITELGWTPWLVMVFRLSTLIFWMVRLICISCRIWHNVHPSLLYYLLLFTQILTCAPRHPRWLYTTWWRWSSTWFKEIQIKCKRI